jgi:hypothetical protein
MAKNKSSTSVSTNALGATTSSTVSASAAAGSTGTASAATGSTGTTGAGSVTGVNNPGLSPAGVVSPKSSSKGLEVKITKRLGGLEKYLPADTSLVINGQTFVVSGLIQSLQTMDDLYTALDTAEQQSKVAITQARQAVNAELPAIEALITGLDNTLRGYFGKGNPILANFGIATGAVKKPSSATLAGAAATAKLTRVARNTLGKKAKLKVTGGKAGVQLVSPDGATIAGSTPASPPAAAPSGSGNGANGSSTTK